MSAENFFHCAPKTLSPAAFQVGIAMYTFANENGFFAASLASMEELTGRGEKTIRRAVTELIEAGVIERTRDGNGQHYAVYRTVFRVGARAEGGHIYLQGGHNYRTNCQADASGWSDLPHNNVSTLARANKEDYITSSVRVYGTETEREKELYVLERARRACAREERRTDAHVRDEETHNTKTDFFRFRGTDNGSRKQWPGPTYVLPTPKEKEKSFAKKEKERPRDPRSIDQSFVLTDEDIAFAKDRKWTPGQIALERDRFVSYFEAKGDKMMDWHSKWRFWVLNGVKFEVERRIKDAKTRGSERPKGL